MTTRPDVDTNLKQECGRLRASIEADLTIRTFFRNSYLIG